jgi:hypothetical protein
MVPTPFLPWIGALASRFLPLPWYLLKIFLPQSKLLVVLQSLLLYHQWGSIMFIVPQAESPSLPSQELWGWRCGEK